MSLTIVGVKCKHSTSCIYGRFGSGVACCGMYERFVSDVVCCGMYERFVSDVVCCGMYERFVSGDVVCCDCATALYDEGC